MLQRLHQFVKTLLTDGVLHTAGVFFGDVWRNTRLNQPLGKKAVLCVYFSAVSCPISVKYK